MVPAGAKEKEVKVDAGLDKADSGTGGASFETGGGGEGVVDIERDLVL